MVRGLGLRHLLAAVVALAIAGGPARAVEARLSLEPAFTHTDTEITDQAGNTTRQVNDVLGQSYRLSLDQAITDHFSASAGGNLLDQRAWTENDRVFTRASSRATGLFGRLTLGTPLLSAGVGVDRREQHVLGSATPSSVTESYTGYTSWRPTDLPELDLRLSRMNTYDVSRRLQDATTDSASLSSRYNTNAYDLRYLLTWTRSADHLNHAETTSIDQTVVGTRSDSLFSGRTTTYVSGTFQNRNISTATAGGGTVARVQVPVTGLSAVETFPATATNIALTPNPLLVDGNTTASASLNVGFGPSALGDRNARDMGARFADVVTPVNTIYVWFDKPIGQVGTALTSAVAVYQSDDNVTWTAVAISAPPLVSPFENRIEVTFTQTQARYLKITMLPLAVGVTTDSAFRDIFVTEAQFLLVLPAALVPRQQNTYAVSGNGSARTLILRTPELAHDLAVSAARQSEGALTTYSIVNGLSLGHRLTPTLAVNARGARQDLDAGRGHEGIWIWNAALTGNPYKTATWLLNYSGVTNDRDLTIGHSITALGRADWYEGISTQASATGSFVSQSERVVNGVMQSARHSSSGQANGTASFTPNTVVTLTVGALYSRSVSFTPETGDVVTEFGRVDGSISFTPAPALSGAGTVSRVLLGARPSTLATLQLNYFPLRGDVQLSVMYSKTLDTAADATTQIYGPTLRWNLRRGVSLTSSYTVLDSIAPVQTLKSRTFATSLLISI